MLVLGIEHGSSERAISDSNHQVIFLVPHNELLTVLKLKNDQVHKNNSVSPQIPAGFNCFFQCHDEITGKKQVERGFILALSL